MRRGDLVLLVVALCVTLTASSGDASAQITPERRAAIRAHMAALKRIYDALPRQTLQSLSAGSSNFVYAAQHWDDLDARLSHYRHLPTGFMRRMSSLVLTPTLVKISDTDPGPGTSVMGGFTESETSTAWCGSNVVVGSNDSGSAIESYYLGTGGYSAMGVFHSSNGGSSFTDEHYLSAGPSVNDSVYSDPSLACSGLRFYYVALHSTFSSGVKLTSDVSISISTNGGTSFGAPIVVASAPATTHLIDKPWMAIDPTTPSTLYVAYTDFDTSHSTCTGQLTSIKVVKSTTSGTSWGAPVPVGSTCATGNGVEIVIGAQILVNTSHVVDVAWEEIASADGKVREQMFAESTNQGTSFSSPAAAAVINPLGNGQGAHPLLQGNFRNYELPSMAIDNKNAKIYIFWDDGGVRVKDVLTVFGTYGYGDILATVSGDGGSTWSKPVRVNTNVEPPNTDQFQPAAAVDSAGNVAVCFYDRAGDPSNYFFGRSCAESTNFGASWMEATIVSATSPPIHDSDVVVGGDYLGDYDVLAVDASGVNSGFGGAFQTITTRGNPNLNFVKFAP